MLLKYKLLINIIIRYMCKLRSIPGLNKNFNLNKNNNKTHDTIEANYQWTEWSSKIPARFFIDNFTCLFPVPKLTVTDPR